MQRLFVHVVLIVYFSFVYCDVTILVAPDTSYITNITSCATSCGSVDCPCIGFASAIDVGYAYYANGSHPIMISAYSGSYQGPDNTQLNVNYSLSVTSISGSSETFFGTTGDNVFFTVFQVVSATFTLSGFQINGAVTPHTIIAQISNGNMQMNDIIVQNSVGDIVTMTNSSLVVASSTIDSCASLVFFTTTSTSSVTFVDTSVTSSTGVIVSDTDQTGKSSLSFIRATITDNHPAGTIIAKSISISNSSFTANTFTESLFKVEQATILDSVFIEETFTESYFIAERQILMENNLFENITCTQLGNHEIQGSVVLVQSSVNDESVSIITNTTTRNCISNQFYNFVNCFANVTQFTAESVIGPVARVTHSTDGITHVFFTDFSIRQGNDSVIAISLLQRSIFDGRIPQVHISQVEFIDFIGTQYPVIINNLGGSVFLDHLKFDNAERVLVSTGDIKISNVIVTNTACPVYSPVIVTEGNILIENLFIQNVIATNDAIIYISDRSIVTGNNVTIIDSKASKSSAIYLETSNATFSNLNCSNSKGDTGGAIHLQTGKLNLSNSFLEENYGKLGGAVYVYFGDFMMEKTIVRGNKADYGGGLYLQEARIEWTNCSCIDNLSFQDGGCLFSRNFVSGLVIEFIVEKNVCFGSGGGIALRNFNQIDFVGSKLSGNRALNGGGLYVSGTSFSSFNGGIISENSALSSGGGVLIKEHAQPTIMHTIISYNHADSTGGGFKISDNSQPILSYLLITENSSPNEGGGISYSDSSFANLSNSLILKNSVNATGGGIVFSISTHGTLTNVTVENNYAKSKGGGIAFYNNCFPTLVNVSVIDNEAPEGAGMSCKDAAAPIIISSTFSGNLASSSGGAAIIYDYGSGNFTDCDFINNSGSGVGGAILLNDFATTYFNSCRFYDNTAQSGGAMFISTQNPCEINYCVFEDNSASDGGALVVTDQSYITFLHCTCRHNIASMHGGCARIEDEAIVTFTNFTVIDNQAAPTGLGNGGGMSIVDRSFVQFETVLIARNIAPAGGAIFLEQFAVIIGNIVTIDSNSAAEGGGILCEGTLMELHNSSFYNNSCTGLTGRGGGLTVISVALARQNVSLCVDCYFSQNTAYRGGGAFISIHSENILSGDSQGTPEPSLTEVCDGSSAPGTISDDNVVGALQNVFFVDNAAVRGGGIYFEQPNAKIGISAASFYGNKANEYGGAIFVVRDRSLTTSDVWMQDSVFSGNGAYYGGTNVGWSVTDKCSNDFCSNCYFGGPADTFDGYDDYRGFASPPSGLIFDTPCPNDVTLSGDSFDVSLSLVDKFLTPVSGHYPKNNIINVSVNILGNCSAESVEGITNHRVTEVGKVTFNSIVLSGYNNLTCSLEFYITSESRFISNQTCDVVFNGCQKNELISEVPGEYDSCIENVSQEQHINQALFLILVIVLLLMFILMVGCFTVLWDRYMVIKPKPFVLPPAEDKEITLDDLLNDSDIKNIPWDDIELGERIGHGATGLVLAGTWQQDSTTIVDIALKEINFGNSEYTDGSVLAMMLSEIRLMCALDNSHIVQFYGISLSDRKQLYLVMELMHQGSLRDLLDKKGNNLSWRMRLKFAISAAKGISYLHHHKIIHRDIKPQNLLVNREWKCKVADFGISTTKDNSSHTVIGTPVYMAPEIFNEIPYTEKIDVYAFAIVLYELYTSKRPYSSPEMDKWPQNQLLLRICNSGLRPDTVGLPSTLNQLLEDCWNESQKLRPSFKEILVRLRRLSDLELPGTNRFNGENKPTRSRWASISAADFELASDEEKGNWLDRDTPTVN